MILESLRRQRVHGYALVQHIQHRPIRPLQTEEGSPYPALWRLLNAKLVKAEWVISSSTNRQAHVYNISRADLSHLECEISSFDRMLEGVELVLGLAGRTANS
jgi:PadR family transcriptional regulator, regulatory protein PadR